MIWIRRGEGLRMPHVVLYWWSTLIQPVKKQMQNITIHWPHN